MNKCLPDIGGLVKCFFDFLSNFSVNEVPQLSRRYNAFIVKELDGESGLDMKIIGTRYANKISQTCCCRSSETASAKSRSSLCKIVTAVPMGPYIAASVGPNTATVRTPNPADKCVIPLSLPM
jgi:hypothetical protein